MKKPRRDTITGIVGLLACCFFIFCIRQIKKPPKLLEPGPRLVPYLAVALMAFCSIAILIQGIRDRNKDEKPFFPPGGIKKVTRSFIMLCVYAVMLNFLGFIISTPFATFAFIYDLKGENKVKPVSAAILAVLATAILYLMFVYGFQVRLPRGKIFS